MKIIYYPASLLFFQFLFSCNQASEISKAGMLLPGFHNQKTVSSGAEKLVFTSTDGGQTWQDISQGLPGNLEEDKIMGNSFFANDKGLFLRVGNGLYHSSPNATAPFWTKEIVTDKHSSGGDNGIAPGNYGLVSLHYWVVNLKKANGTSVWSPLFESFQGPRLRSVFETAGGTIFIGTDKGYFKTVNDGASWKQVHTGDLVGHLAEADGVLLGISGGRIIRSTDNGETWAEVSSGGVVAFDVKPIKGGFAAITASSESGTRGLSASYDGGKTWQAIEARPQHKNFTASIWRTWNDRPRVKANMNAIIQVDENFFCALPGGIFKSSDKGKSWTLLLPSVDDKVFNLFVAGKVIYAIPSRGGC
jgi:photosystem II stability/assembly factor-like uncharacterized protein